jgi:hypothetical protein
VQSETPVHGRPDPGEPTPGSWRTASTGPFGPAFKLLLVGMCLGGAAIAAVTGYLILGQVLLYWGVFAFGFAGVIVALCAYWLAYSTQRSLREPGSGNSPPS